jgi:hypothetical protein
MTENDRRDERFIDIRELAERIEKEAGRQVKCDDEDEARAQRQAVLALVRDLQAKTRPLQRLDRKPTRRTPHERPFLHVVLAAWCTQLRDMCADLEKVPVGALAFLDEHHADVVTSFIEALGRLRRAAERCN